MPPHASANPEIKQLYINGHFCYVFKFGIVTNGLGIIRHIPFYNKDFFSKHPLINPQTFLGDAALDSVGLYKELLSGNTLGMINILLKLTFHLIREHTLKMLIIQSTKTELPVVLVMLHCL